MYWGISSLKSSFVMADEQPVLTAKNKESNCIFCIIIVGFCNTMIYIAINPVPLIQQYYHR